MNIWIIILYMLGMVMADMAASVAIEKHGYKKKGKAIFVLFWPIMAILCIVG